jgi:hypothetical protein
MGEQAHPEHPHGTPPGQDPEFVPPGHGGTPPGQADKPDKPDKPDEPDEEEDAPHPEHPIVDPDAPYVDPREEEGQA